MKKSKTSIGDLLLSALGQMGVTLVDIDLKSKLFYINLDKTKLIQSIDDTLKSVYGILWTATYGKLTDSNRDLKIDLRYKVVNTGNEDS